MICYPKMYLWTLIVHLLYNWEFDCKGFFFSLREFEVVGISVFMMDSSLVSFFSSQVKTTHVRACESISSFESITICLLSFCVSHQNVASYMFSSLIPILSEASRCPPMLPCPEIYDDINHKRKRVTFIRVGVSLSTRIPCFLRVVSYPFFFFFFPHQKSFNSHRSRSHTNFR